LDGLPKAKVATRFVEGLLRTNETNIILSICLTKTLLLAQPPSGNEWHMTEDLGM
jgi:hypothetical protein